MNLFIRKLSNLKITVACLLWLLILTFWGTVAQVEHGLYQAQKTFFYSWFFLVKGFLPLPGAQLTMWVLFINLVAATLTRHVFRWSNIGILITHLGLLSYFVSAFVIFVSTQESQVTLLEGEGTNVSVAYHDWELAFWKAEDDHARDVIAYDADRLRKDEFVSDLKLKANLRLRRYERNAAVKGERIQVLPVDREPERNFPAAVLEIVSLKMADKPQTLILDGDGQPQTVKLLDEDWTVSLRRQRYPLPLSIKLDDFKADFHPGTEVAKSYESFATIFHGDLSREVRIYMNNPLRFKNYTFFQASYSIDQMGRERSTLAVVRNIGAWMPYVSSLLTFLGLAIHFLMRAMKRGRDNS